MWLTLRGLFRARWTDVVHFDLDPGEVVAAAQEHRSSLKNPPRSVDEYLDTLERQGLIQTAAALRGHGSVL